MLERIGTTRREVCDYDGKEHLTKLTDYLIRLTGDTYHHKNDIYLEGFWYDGDDKAWYKNVETEEEANRLFHKYSGIGIKFAIKPIFRIVDM